LPGQNTTLPPLPDLPVLAAGPALRAALARGHAVLAAAPGSGKTTLVPLLLRDEPWLGGRRILILEPRRPAARMAARRMAALLGEQVGDGVGYQVRFERRVSAATRIEVLTEGLLLRRLQADPELQGVGLLVFDEFHERNLFGDLSLALSLDVTGSLRPDLRLLVMSASLEVEPVRRLLDATLVEAAGQSHPVELIHGAVDADLREPVEACRPLVLRALAECAGDVLVFLPGRREIERARERLAADCEGRAILQTLYGDMPAAAQDAVITGAGLGRRVILATDIAETSLTIEGVAAVVDSGLARRPVFDPRSGLTRLETRRISKASALQRAGRAGRLGPGRCYRAWTPARHQRLEDWTAPEITAADLAGLVLELASWGLSDPADLAWLDPPPQPHWQAALSLLQQLGALDGDGRVTAAGRAMATLPVHPRLAHLLVLAGAGHPLAADIAALLSERDPLRRGVPGGRTAGLGERLAALAGWRSGRRAGAAADPAALQRIDRAAAQLRRLAPAAPAGPAVAADPGACLALAYPDRVARCSDESGRRYLLRNGRAALLDEEDPLRGTPFLAVGLVDAGVREGRIGMAAALAEADLETLFADVIEQGREVRWDPAREEVVARRVRRLGAILLAEEPVPLCPDDPVAEILCVRVRAAGLAAFFDDPVELRARVRLMARLDPGGDWPDLSEAALLDGLEDWLLPWLEPGGGMRQLRRLSLERLIEARLGWERMLRLDEWLPTRFLTPAGTHRSVHYATEGPPRLSVPLPEIYGLCEGPRVARGAQPLVLELLSPAGRPLALTTDLAGFWAGAYKEVRKEMRGRYPKHSWPEDPAHAEATRFGRRRA
jgi:ATP-dependent helicase HrpB